MTTLLGYVLTYLIALGAIYWVIRQNQNDFGCAARDNRIEAVKIASLGALYASAFIIAVG